MKRHILYSLLATTLLFGACSKDFLDRTPVNKIPEEEFWRTENDVKLAVNAIYGKLSDGMYDDGATDLVHAQYPWESASTAISAGSLGADIDAGWSYIPIRTCNYFLENVDKAIMDETLKERYKAEVRFIRAYLYIPMVEKFGDIPLVTKVLTKEESNVPRVAKKEVLDFLFKELQEVSTKLPVSYSSEKGRITKGAALALQSRLYLMENNWEQAARTAQEVMGLGYKLFQVSAESELNKKDNYAQFVDFENADDEHKFRLGLRSYEGIFQVENEGNDEVILDRQYIRVAQPQSNNTLLAEGSVGGWSSLTPTQNLVNLYVNYKTGEPVNPVSAEVRAAHYAKADKADFVKEFKNRDPRFYASILFETAPWNALTKDGGYQFTWSSGKSNMSITGYNFRKLVDPTSSREQIDSYANVILIRYAEVLLNYAEAQNEKSGPDATIFDALDQLRVRAGMPKVDRSTYGSQSKLRDLIRNERAVELVLEGVRYYDIRRWKTAPNVMKNIYDVKNGLAQERIWNDRLYLMPVPQSQIDLSYGVLTQNTGY
ncbi:membrane protein [Sphingobacterium faecium NBRC 15299]|uniref:RagB/SusD family nutrient uptake outer membrane protein n=1 Tax=Sphingobacterium faecium TaxID=34087 RepID=UPI000D39CB0F|nr:RagB/SusD family nutrient uptake outer membrane protein [Sphingobacterium faecium]PTX12903.1 putative outer membrane starch-binding protein [Sphingobacterium faecium]GEM65747.1 membrane protein [Sphingobacterium faecium NBRC 15299]